MTSFNEVETLIVVPLRLESTRLEKKILRTIGQKTLAEHVADRAQEAEKIFKNSKYFLAIDNEETLNFLKDKIEDPSRILMTSENCQSGSDRVYDVLSQLETRENLENLRNVVNFQGDSPFFPLKVFKELFLAIEQNSHQMLTPVIPWPEGLNTEEKSHVKVVLNKNNEALYFSRFPIPHSRKDDHTEGMYYHLGCYVYSVGVLKVFAQLKKSFLEKSENLEQLRALENSIPVSCAIVDNVDHNLCRGIDTQSDLDWANKFLENNKI